MSQDKEAVVEIKEQVEEVTPIEVLPEDFSKEEKELAEKHGLVKKADEVVKDEVKKIDSDKKATFEDIEKDEKRIGEYNKNEQALYWKWKHDKKERQQAQAERDLALVREKTLKQEVENARKEGSLTVGKLKQIEALLSGKEEDITIEAIQEILKAEPAKVDDKNKPLTKADIEAMQKEAEEKKKEVEVSQKALEKRVQDLEDFGVTKYGKEEYDAIIEAAHEVLDGKVDLPDLLDVKDLSQKFVSKVGDKNLDAEDVADYVYKLAKLNPKFGKTDSKPAGDAKKATKEEVEKVLKNSTKTQTSAAVSGGNGRRLVSESELTIEDASRLTPAEWAKLKPETKKRLLQG